MKKVENLNNLLCNLEKNPLFQMSLGSKELFHSNLLAWIISQKSQTKFVHKFLEEILKLENKIVKIIQYPEREKKNIDLRFKLEMEDEKQSQLWIIIENKVKSLPYKEQLVDCEEKTREELKKELKNENCTIEYYLVSLVNPAGEILPGNWKLIRYKNIAEKLRNSINEINPNSDEVLPFKSIIESYIDFIENLHHLSELLEIKDSGRNEFFDYTNRDKDKNDRAKFEKIRLHDLYLKIKHQQISDLIKRSIRDIENEAGIKVCDPWQNIKVKDKNPPDISNGIYVNSGFSKNNGMVDFKYIPFTFEINNEKVYCVFCIQLQGGQLRYALEFVGKLSLETKLANRLLYTAGFKMLKDKTWISFSADFLKEKKLDRNLYFSNSELQGKAKEKKENDPDKIFPSFGLFIYKYDAVKRGTTVEQIVNLYVMIFEYLISKKGYFENLIKESKKELGIK